MEGNTSRSQKIGWVIFAIVSVYMFGLGWLYSWWVVPTANQFGSDAYSGLLGFIWAPSVPLGAFIVAIGAALIARVKRRVFWLLILLVVLFVAWRMVGFVFFVVADRDLRGIFGIANYVLRLELADKFSVPIGSTIIAASGVLVLLVLRWGFTYFGQLISRHARTDDPNVDEVPQIAAAD